MRTNNIAALEYNIDENWGFYVDIENMKSVSLNNNVNFIGFEINSDYIKIANERLFGLEETGIIEEETGHLN